MATEHQLTLKAVLDTSQVKNELNKLRQNQQNATQGGTSAGFNGNISSVLRNLNTSIQNLQRSIDKLLGLGRQTAKVQTQPALIPTLARGSQGTLSQPQRSNAQRSNVSRLIQPMNEFARQASDLYDAPRQFRAARTDLMAARKALRQTYFGGRSAASAYRVMQDLDYAGYSAAENFMERNPTLAGFERSVSGYRRQINRRNIALETSRYSSYLPDRTPVDRRALGMRKMGIRLGAGIVMGGLSEYAAATGNEGMSKGLSFGSNVATYAGMGMMFGPQGAAMGAIFGAAKSGLDMLTESAKNAASALDQQASRVSGAAGTDKSVYGFFRGLNDEKALKDKDVGYFKQQLESANTRYDVAQKYLKGSGIGIEEGALEAYEKETLTMEQIKQGKFKPKTIDDMKLLQRYGGMSEEKLASTIKVRNETADEYKRIAGDISGYKGRVDEVQKIIEELKKPDTSKEKARQESITSRIETLQDKLSNMQAPGLENVNSLASQGFMISQSDDEARLEESNSYLRDIASITREIKNLEKEKETSTYL